MENRLIKADQRARAKVDKFAARQTELADAALVTLAELGYARTSLREIAENTEFSHGVLRYYFEDKLDLILHCIRQYKATCVRRYDVTIETATSQDVLFDGFLEQLSVTLLTETHLHRPCCTGQLLVETCPFPLRSDNALILRPTKSSHTVEHF